MSNGNPLLENQSSPTGIQQTSARVRQLLNWLLAGLALLIVLERFGAVAMQFLRRGFEEEVIRRLAYECISACPESLYFLALWWVRAAMSEFAAGKLYTVVVSRMLDRVGTMLATASFIAVFLVPSASRAVGFGPGYLIAYDVSGLVLGAVGLSLKVIAPVLRRASELQTELDEIF